MPGRNSFQWQFQNKTTPLPCLAFNLYIPAMKPCKLLYKRQSQTSALNIGHKADLVEIIKYLFNLIGRYSDACIPDPDLYLSRTITGV